MLSSTGALQEAINCFQETYSYYKERDLNQAGDALGNLGFACHRNGEIERSLDCANQLYLLIESNRPRKIVKPTYCDVPACIP